MWSWGIISRIFRGSNKAQHGLGFGGTKQPFELAAAEDEIHRAVAQGTSVRAIRSTLLGKRPDRHWCVRTRLGAWPELRSALGR